MSKTESEMDIKIEGVSSISFNFNDPCQGPIITAIDFFGWWSVSCRQDEVDVDP